MFIKIALYYIAFVIVVLLLLYRAGKSRPPRSKLEDEMEIKAMEDKELQVRAWW